MTKWKPVPVEPDDNMLDIGCGIIAHSTIEDLRREDIRTMFVVMLEAAPQPPRLSDERIKELSDLHMNMYGFDDVAFARAIEREILGKGST